MSGRICENLQLKSVVILTLNEDGTMELLTYISITNSLKCDAAFDAQSWTTLDQYIREG